MNAHLVTITSTSEQDFLFTQLVSKAPTYGYYFLGIYYDSANFSWHWITGETDNVDHGTPPASDYGYLSMRTDKGDWYYTRSDGYINGTGNQYATGYVCEWDSNHFVSSIAVPDMNGNGVDEIASLYLDYGTNKHTVQIRDPQKHVTLSTLTFGNGPTPPLGLAVIADINGNNQPEIAVLAGRNVIIKDIKNNAKKLKTISFLSAGKQARTLNALPDSNDNGADELSVLGVSSDGTATTETRDSDTGAKLFSDNF